MCRVSKCNVLHRLASGCLFQKVEDWCLRVPFQLSQHQALTWCLMEQERKMQEDDVLQKSSFLDFLSHSHHRFPTISVLLASRVQSSLVHRIHCFACRLTFSPTCFSFSNSHRVLFFFHCLVGWHKLDQLSYPNSSFYIVLIFHNLALKHEKFMINKCFIFCNS